MTAMVDLTADEFYAPDDDDIEAENASLPPDPDDSPADEPAAPYGYMLDRATGEMRPKRRPGRPKDAAELADAPPVAPAADKPPAARVRPSRARKILGVPADVPPVPPVPPADVPMPKGGVIAKGVNKLYRRAGRIARVWNYEVGSALIEITKPDPEDEDFITVGQAWENLAASNPRIRAWALRMIAGGDWQELIMAHAPLGVAIVTTTWVGRLLPLGRLAEAVLVPDDDEPDDDGGAPEGGAPPLQPEDVRAMADLSAAQAQQIARRMGVKVPGNVAAAAMREAQRHAAAMGIPGAGAPITPAYENRDLEPGETDAVMANGSGPVAVRKPQPKHTTRSQRRR